MTQNNEKMVECGWCDWEGELSETEPLGDIQEGDFNDFLRECPDCGEPTPTVKGK